MVLLNSIIFIKKLKLGVNILIHLNIPGSDCGHLEKIFHDVFKIARLRAI